MCGLNRIGTVVALLSVSPILKRTLAKQPGGESMRSVLVLVTMYALVLLGAREVSSQDLGFERLGLRGGVSLNPDQFHGGLFADMGRVFGNVHFRPSFDLGWGNGVVLGAANADALYLFRPRSWRPFAGGGLGINFFDVTEGVGEGRGLDIEPVLNLVGGIEWGKSGKGSIGRYLLEGRLGLGDTPDFKLSFGTRF